MAWGRADYVCACNCQCLLDDIAQTNASVFCVVSSVLLRALAASVLFRIETAPVYTVQASPCVGPPYTLALWDARA